MKTHICKHLQSHMHPTHTLPNTHCVLSTGSYITTKLYYNIPTNLRREPQLYSPTYCACSQHTPLHSPMLAHRHSPTGTHPALLSVCPTHLHRGTLAPKQSSPYTRLQHARLTPHAPPARSAHPYTHRGGGRSPAPPEGSTRPAPAPTAARGCVSGEGAGCGGGAGGGAGAELRGAGGGALAVLPRGALEAEGPRGAQRPEPGGGGGSSSSSSGRKEPSSPRAPLNDGRQVRLRRWRHLLRRLGGGQSPRARHLHRAQGAGRVRGLLVPRLRGGGRLHLAQRQHLPGLLGAGQAPRAGRGDQGQVDVPGRVVPRLQGALRGAAEPHHPGPLRGHLEQRAAGRLRRGDLRGWRTAHARAKADAADQAAQAARQESDIARAVARELSPSFYQPGPDYIKQRFQESVEVKENPEEKVQEKAPSPKESPHFYRKGTTPPGTPEASPKHSSPLPSEPSPTKQLKRQNSSSKARLTQEKKSLASETVTAVVNKPLYSKVPVKEEIAVKHQPKFSAHHNPISTENGELHGHYHGYYVKMNPALLPHELREEDEDVNPSPSALSRISTPQKPSPARSVTNPDAKESKSDTKVKKPELAAPKNPANNESHSSAEKEVEIHLGPNSVMIALVMLLNIGLAILFVHFLT
uniref:Junctophilin 1 n=1 Tax=Chrysemys picta bellii TaxID=8478 RepID=A0A8C3FMV1_CHRPI